jgi:hypothetical protein
MTQLPQVGPSSKPRQFLLRKGQVLYLQDEGWCRIAPAGLWPRRIGRTSLETALAQSMPGHESRPTVVRFLPWLVMRGLVVSPWDCAGIPRRRFDIGFFTAEIAEIAEPDAMSPFFGQAEKLEWSPWRLSG